MKIKFIFVTLFIWIPISIIYSQSSKLFSADVDLSNSLINQVYQDRNGIIWIATEDGLNRYDGSKFTIYKHDENNTNSPLHNYVRGFLEDKQGNFYIAYLNGLQIYDDASNTFKEIPIILKDGNKFSAHIITMIERRNGQILIAAAGHGVCELKTSDNNEIYAEQLYVENLGVSVNALLEDKDENLWVSSDDKGLIRLDKNGNTKTFFTTDRIQPTSLCQDKEGIVFVGSFNSGLYKFNPANDSFLSIPYPANSGLPIKSLFVNSKNHLLVGTDGYGMKIYRKDDTHLMDEDFKVINFDFSKSKVHSILEDQSGNIWLGIFQKGLMFLPALTGDFNYIGYKSVKNNLIGSNCVMSLFQDNEGTLWVGTDSDGLYGINLQHNISRHFSHSELPGSAPTTIMCIYEDSNRNLWLGSYLHGLAKMNRKTGKCEYMHIYDQNKSPVTKVYSLLEDDQKNLWIATMGGGLFYMNITTGRITRFPEKAGYVNSWINCLLKSQDNRLYVGTYDGLTIIDLRTKKIVSAHSSHLFERKTIYTLYEDAKGMIWLGTSDGLSSFNPKTNITVTYTTNDGLPNNVICAIQGEKNGKIWVSTNSGISHFTPEERSFTNYHSNDGLQGNEFSKNSTFMDNKGQIYFGGLNGITYFHPDKITVPEKTLQVRLTDFYIHDQAVKKGMKSGSKEIISESVMNAKTFHLAHNDNSFTIEFSTTEFSTPERISYIYSMNDRDWIRLRPGTNRVSFNNLTPGKYTFKVMAQDFNIQSNVKEIEIFISTPWYLSFWSKCLYSLIGFLLIFLIISQIRQRYKTRQEALEYLHLQEIQEAKLQFFINISHEIRTPMSLVMSPLKKLMATDKNGERQKVYSTMNRNIDRVLRLINQLMDIRKIDKGQMNMRFQEVDMVSLLQDIHSFFEEQALTKQIKFVFHHNNIEQLNAWIDLKNFDKVIINVLSNAFKFTPENGEITVSLRTPTEQTAADTLNNTFEIIISDSGVGIDENEIERIFERFYQAKNIHTKSYEGTGVGLHLARSIIELHHGKIQAENNPDGKGCRFIIRLPLGNAHLKPEEMDNEPINTFKERHMDTLMIVEPEKKEEIKIKSKSKRYVLVVDDDKDIRDYINRELSPDYHMKECANGKEALDAILKKAPDLVISDVVMPEMDGITLCRKIKQNIHINHIPVILLTAKSKEEDNVEGLDTGADAYIVKPFNIEILKKTAQNIIKNREMLRNNFTGSQQQKDKITKITIKSSDDKLLERVMKVINKNMSNPELNVEMIATEVGISRVHLHRKLKELTNQSTRDLIRNIRLQQAASLLSSKKLTVFEVATATGFSNMTHFSTAFKEVYGMPPVSYMEMHLNREKNEEE